jgi:7-keto-8-aminopelargonate synthetase-like enzyme
VPQDFTRSAALESYQAELQDLADKNRLRTLDARLGLDFTSNDYLGLAASKRLAGAVTAAIARGTPIGAGGSRLLRGNAPEHEALEAAAAAFLHAERTLFFGSGYVANFAVFSTLPQRGDLIILDQLIHVSAREGHYAADRRQSVQLDRFRDDSRFECVRQTGTITAMDLKAPDAGYLAQIGPRLQACFREARVLLRARILS